MQRLFSGTPFDRPSTCERCGTLEAECTCPPPVVEKVHIAPEQQTARIKVEKRPKNKVVTCISGLIADGNDLEELAAKLKATCGSGGTLKEGVIEIQGDHRVKVEEALKKIGYQVKKG